MNNKRQSTLAALLVVATLAAPGVAMADASALPVVVPAPAPAAPLLEMKVTREEAIAAVTKLFTIPEAMGAPNVSFGQSKTDATWQLEWHTPANQLPPQSIYATVDGMTGALLNFNHDGGPAAQDATLAYSRTDAYKLAAGWLAKLAPDRQNALRYVDDPLQYGFWGGGSAIYQFHWDRMEQGYPVANGGINIAIDARTGDLRAFSLAWRNDLTFTKPDTMLDKAHAEGIYRGQLPMQLFYRRYQKPATDQGEWKLVYRPYGGNFPFVSQDGQLFDANMKPIDFTQWTDLKPVPAGTAPYQKPDRPLTRDQALAMAKAITGRSDDPTGVNCRETGDQQKVQACNFSWYKADADSNPNVDIDLTAGLVTNYGNWSNIPMKSTDPVEPKYTEDQARQIAMAFMQQFRPDYAGNGLLGPVMSPVYVIKEQPLRSYHVNFLFLHDSVPVLGQDASVEVDAMTGEIRYFWAPVFAPSAKEPLPAQNGISKPAAAVDSFLQNQGLELTWVTTTPAEYFPGKVMPGRLAAQPTTVLVWAPRHVYQVDAFDAFTGVPYDYNGRDLIEASRRPVDIDGHFAQREIELLWARGIFELKDGKFNPNDSVSATELARWLVLARGMQPYMTYDFALNFSSNARAGAKLAASADAPYVGAALQSGILLPEDFAVDADPGAPVSREMAALWVVRALGYGDIAKMENRIQMSFSDQAQIGAKYANAVAMLQGLKVSRGDEAGNFNPQRLITRGEAAKLLFAVAAKGQPIPIWK